MKLRDKNQFYTFMVVPHDAAGKTVSFRVPAFVVRYLLLVVVVSVAVFSLSLVYSSVLSGRLIHYGMVVDQQAQSDRQLDSILNQKNSIQQELQSVLDQNNEIRKQLGLKVNKITVKFEEKTEDPKKTQIFGLNYKFNRMSSILDLSLKEAAVTKVSLDELKAKVKEVQARLASTPSIWPIHGRLASFFGYRSFPWRGLHTGLDIDASYGSPVKVTAPGVVCFAGWMPGYGRVVEVDHGQGFKTLYGHNSKLNVVLGEKVNKGQIICFVGMTGNTTGPHLHYEVRKNDVPINPMAFLNLTVLSAGRYL